MWCQRNKIHVWDTGSERVHCFKIRIRRAGRTIDWATAPFDARLEGCCTVQFVLKIDFSESRYLRIVKSFSLSDSCYPCKKFRNCRGLHKRWSKKKSTVLKFFFFSFRSYFLPFLSTASHCFFPGYL